MKNMQTSEEIAQQGCKDENVSEVVVDRRQWKPMGANMGSNTKPVRSLEAAESKVVAGDRYSTETEYEIPEKAASSKEVAVGALVDARVGRNAMQKAFVRHVADSKGGAGFKRK